MKENIPKTTTLYHMSKSAATASRRDGTATAAIDERGLSRIVIRVNDKVVEESIINFVIKPTLKPSDSCVCGSGRKLKQCCLKFKREYIANLVKENDALNAMYTRLSQNPDIINEPTSAVAKKHIALMWELAKTECVIDKILTEKSAAELRSQYGQTITHLVQWDPNTPPSRFTYHSLQPVLQQNMMDYIKLETAENLNSNNLLVRYMFALHSMYPPFTAIAVIQSENEGYSRREFDRLELLAHMQLGYSFNLPFYEPYPESLQDII